MTHSCFLLSVDWRRCWRRPSTGARGPDPGWAGLWSRARHPGDRGSTLFVKIVAFDAQFNERFLLNKPYFIILLETFNTNVLWLTGFKLWTLYRSPANPAVSSVHKCSSYWTSPTLSTSSSWRLSIQMSCDLMASNCAHCKFRQTPPPSCSSSTWRLSIQIVWD